ncbi:MAG: GFA family protein [Yoonia sp.]
MISGRCMCGDVTVEVAKLTDRMNACHCEMCRRWAGSAFVAVHGVAADVTFSGPVKTIASSKWATRGWCDNCGSALFYRANHDGSYGLAVGLFDNAAGKTLNIEYYVDQKPDGFAYMGDHKRMTEAETLAYFGISEGEMP